MAKFLRKPTPILTPGALIAQEARKVDAAVALQEALLASVEAEVVCGQTAEIETGTAFDLDAIVDCCDDDVEYRSVGAEIADALGCELPDDGVPDAVVDLLEKLVGQVRGRVRKDLEALDLKTRNGYVVIELDAVKVSETFGAVVDTCVDVAQARLRDVERVAIAHHNTEVQEANAKVLPMTKPEPTPAPVATPTPAPVAEAAEAAPTPAPKKPRAPRKAKAAPAPTAEAAPAPTAEVAPAPTAEAAPAAETAPAAPAAPAKHPVDIAEALLVLDDVNAPPEAIAAALAILAE